MGEVQAALCSVRWMGGVGGSPVLDSQLHTCLPLGLAYPRAEVEPLLCVAGALMHPHLYPQPQAICKFAGLSYAAEKDSGLRGYH